MIVRRNWKFPIESATSERLSLSITMGQSWGMMALFLLVAFLPLVLRTNAQATPSGQTQAPRPSGQNPEGMRIYIWAGLKSHLAGQHDYPQFLADWSKILTEHGAVVDGALHAPSPKDLDRADVVVI